MLSTRSDDNLIDFCITVVAICIATALPLPAFAKPQAIAAPPATGLQQERRTGYDHCVDHPSPDGAAINCDPLRAAAPVAKPKAKRQRP